MMLHCEQLMEHSRIPLMSGNIQHDFRCVCCGQKEREIRNARGVLLRWINVTVKERLAAQQAA